MQIHFYSGTTEFALHFFVIRILVFLLRAADCLSNMVNITVNKQPKIHYAETVYSLIHILLTQEPKYLLPVLTQSQM